MITPERLTAISPAAGRYAVELTKQMAEAGIMANPLRASMFLGQIHVESLGFNAVVESLNYSATALKKMFGRHRISLADADRYGRTSSHPADQVMLGNILYGGKFGRESLGNTEPGDGWNLRGRGLKQLTGRDNYRRFSLAWLGDESLLATPERVADADGAVASAVWFWTNKRLNVVADRGSVEDVTRIVNGGTTALAERELQTKIYRGAWRDPPDFSRVVSSVKSTETPIGD